MLREYTPVAPTFSVSEGRYTSEIDVTISVPDNETVYYTTDGTDPSESGLIYTANTKLHVSEGKMTIKAIGFTENGTPSEQISADYTVIIPDALPRRRRISNPANTKKLRLFLCVRARKRIRMRRRLSPSIIRSTAGRRRRNRPCMWKGSRSSCRREKRPCAPLRLRKTARSVMK